MDLSIFQDQRSCPASHGSFGRSPIDYLEQAAFMEKHKSGPTPWEGGGVLLPLFYRPGEEKKEEAEGEFVFLLNKRSRNLPQGGDLCAPGGGDHPLMDANAQKILASGIFPSLQSPALRMAKETGRGRLSNDPLLLGQRPEGKLGGDSPQHVQCGFFGPPAHLPAAVAPLDHFSPGWDRCAKNGPTS